MIKKRALYSLILVGCLSLSILAEASLPAEDIAKLSKASASEAEKQFVELYIKYIEGPRTSSPEREQQPELYDEAAYYFAKNLNVRRYYENFFATTPHTLSTGRERAKVFGRLRNLKAEWVARLMIQEILVDRKHQEFNNDPHPPLTEDEIISRIANNRLSDVVRNDGLAVMNIVRLELEGMPKIGIGGTMPKDGLALMRQWIEKNEHRLSELLLDKWGRKAILNKDMPRQGESKKSIVGKRVPKRLEVGARSGADRENDKSEIAGNEVNDFSNGVTLIVSFGLMILVFFSYGYKKRKAKR